MTGSKAEETVTTTVEINEFSDNEDLRGKKIDLAIEILDVKRVEQKADEDLVSQLGLESPEKFREMIRSTLESRLQYAQREQIRDQINKSLTESANWELPPDLLRRQSRRELDRSVIEMRSSGFSDQEIQARENLLRRNPAERALHSGTDRRRSKYRSRKCRLRSGGDSNRHAAK
jgi:trigger factor